MRIHHSLAGFVARSQDQRARREAAASAAATKPTAMLPSDTVILPFTGSTQWVERAMTNDDRFSISSERDRTLAERDAAVEEAAFLREQLKSAEAYHAALMNGARADAQFEREALIGQLAILERELEFRAPHQAPLREGTHALHE
jgi:hypothetical protein